MNPPLWWNFKLADSHLRLHFPAAEALQRVLYLFSRTTRKIIKTETYRQPQRLSHDPKKKKCLVFQEDLLKFIIWVFLPPPPSNPDLRMKYAAGCAFGDFGSSCTSSSWQSVTTWAMVHREALCTELFKTATLIRDDWPSDQNGRQPPLPNPPPASLMCPASLNRKYSFV